MGNGECDMLVPGVDSEQSRECPFCGEMHHSLFPEVVDEMVMACRERLKNTHGEWPGSLAAWVRTPEATWGCIQTCEMTAAGATLLGWWPEVPRTIVEVEGP